MKQKHDFRLAAYTFSKCGLNEEALHTMELSKGRALAERYASRLADASDVITPEESRRMEKLRWQLAANNQRLNEYLNTPGTANQLEKRQDLDRDKEQSEQEYREYRAALQNKYPKYKELSEPRVPTALEAGKLLPEGTVYLSFIAFEGEVMALLLTPDGQVHTVDMDDVPALNQKVQAYRILLSYPTFYKQQQVQMFLWQGADQQVKAAAAAPEPGARRLEKPEDTDEGLQRLGELATHIRGGIAINDNREKYAWPNLPGTGKEVDEVAALFPPDTRRVYKKKQASEKVLRNLDRSGELAGYKILLFATHGIFNPKVPELSALVLSQVGNQAPENGYITVSKWMGYNLRSDLVYLSACQTGLGKAQDGEGIIGIPYALCIAGNQDTVMTLWETDDEKARAFSVSFFKKLRLGQGPVQALSATKREFLHGRGSDRNPNSWAAFLLYGI